MTAFGKPELLPYMRSARLGVVSSLAPGGAPQSALVGIATTDDFEIVFDTVATSRKHANMLADNRVSLVIAGPAEQTLQLDGHCAEVPVNGTTGADFREAYYRAWPDGRDRLAWPGIAYWRISPKWARYSDFDRGPLIAEFRW
jgi:hypothetical protein